MNDNTDGNQSVRPVRAKKWYKCKKIIVLAVLFIIIALAAFVCLSHTKPTKEAARINSRDLDWITYTNDELKFSIDFPSEWGMGTDKLAESFSNGKLGELNLILCPPENKVLEKDGGAFSACRIDYTELDGRNIPHYRGPIIYLSWRPNNDPAMGADYKDPTGINKLSPDKKYFYSLTLNDDRGNRYSDIYNKMVSSLKFIDGKSTDDIIWLEPQKLDDLRIFAPYTPDYINNNYIKSGGRQFEPTYHLVGRINSGKYTGADIISAIYGVDGKSYTILRIDGKYRILSKYNDDFNDYDPNNFAIELRTDLAYDIPDLDYPDEISLTEDAIFQKTDEPENIFDPNSPETKESLSSKKIGKSLDGKDIYNLSDGNEMQEIGILLPNGTLITYSL